MSSKQCNELSNTSTEDTFLILSELQISKDDLKSILESSILQALEIKKQKNLEKNGSYITIFTQQNNIPIPNYSATLDFDDMMGIIGEIVSEIYHRECLQQDPLYIKWQETGTSKSKGLDLVFHKNDQIYSIECKHPHESLKNPSNDKATVFLRTVKGGFKSHDDYRTAEFMTKLYLRHLKDRRLLTGSQIDLSELNNKITLLIQLIKKNNLIEEIDVTADKIYHTSKLSNELNSRLDFKNQKLISKSVGVVLLLIENFLVLSEEVFSTHGN